MKKRVIHRAELALLLGLAVMFAWATATERMQQGISDQVIRLHVVANSDREEDQKVKLEVRDAVLYETRQLIQSAESRNSAARILSEHLPQLEAAANEALAKAGSGDMAQVSLKRELFGTRYYDSFALPGGYYDALRVTIGAGEGSNWWCVVYPQICTAVTAEELRSVAAMGGLSTEQIGILEGSEPEYELKFRSIELLEDLLGWFRSGGAGIPVSR